MTLPPRAVVVTRPTELDELLARHSTRQAAAFFLSRRGRTLDEIDRRHRELADAIATVTAAIPAGWRRGRVARDDLDRFAFAPDDVVITIGSDGLVANVAKYLDGQPVIGVNADHARAPGVLVPHAPADVAPLLSLAVSPGAARLPGRTMAAIETDDGQALTALNELYVGHASHQSARYRLTTADGHSERQSSSGVLAGTGTGATGWLRSVAVERGISVPVASAAERRVCWFVREAWPSRATGTALTRGALDEGEQLEIVAESDDLVVFGDGIESDALHLRWGQRATVMVAAQRLRLLDATVGGTG